MGIQSSVNALMQQLYTIGAIGAGLREQKKQTKGQEKTANEAKIQTEIAAGNAPMKDGKVDPEWLQKRREAIENNKSTEERYKEYKGIPSDVTLHPSQLKAVQEADDILINTGYELDPKTIDGLAIRNSFIEQEELKNEVARKVAKMSVKARTNNINKTKADFNAHTASLIKYYSKGSGNP